MKKVTRPRSSSLFLIELIFAILLFAAASCVCVSFFVKARTKSHDAAALTDAVNEVSSAAEVLSSGDSPDAIYEAVRAAYPNASFEENTIHLTDDITVSYRIENDVLYADITKNDASSGESLYTLPVCHFLKGGQ